MENLTEAILKLNDTLALQPTDGSGWALFWITAVLVVITAVYVGATIWICVYNGRSAKATQEQTKELQRQLGEQKRQFDETNRPSVDISLQFKGEFAYFVIENLGTRLARNVKIHMNDEFINRNGQIQQGSVDECFKNLTETVFDMSVGQRFYLALGNGWQIQKFPSVKVSISYEDSQQKIYKSEALVDFKNYNFLTFFKSPLEEVDATLKEINKTLEEIKRIVQK